MISAYTIAYNLGFILLGCVIGLFPLVAGIVKKRVFLGIILLLICGFSSYVSPFAPIIISVVSGLVVCFLSKK